MANKIIVHMVGRLGNQMFRYAFAMIIQEQYGGEIILDFFDVEKHPDAPHDGWADQIEQFNTFYTKVRNTSFSKIARIKKRFWPPKDLAIGQKILYLFQRLVVEILFSKYNGIPYDLLPIFWKKYSTFLTRRGLYIFPQSTGSEIVPNKYQNYFLDTHFGEAKYFESHMKLLVKEFVSIDQISPKNEELYQKIQNSDSVCVTIRRGDFLSKQFLNDYFQCGSMYFDEGIRIIKEKISKPTFIFFSDDLDYADSYAKKVLSPDDSYLVEEAGNSVAEKLRLMASCKHFVISNSTFSWWCQLLGQAPDKVVVAPEKWYLHRSISHVPIEQKSWIKVGDEFMD